jgi:hypothetical protein
MKEVVSFMPWLFYYQGKISWYTFYKRLGGHHIQSGLEASLRIEPLWKYFPHTMSVLTLILSHLWFCCSFWDKRKKSFKKIVWKENKYPSVLFSVKFVFFSSCFWEVLLQWSSLWIHKTGETSVKASFHLIQVHF